ncbi:hypothetical protein NM688_g4669 [Phlebia brevispora]|uniref:Uncharacterized protein n=1 Tax=Phlebia brevispora TaxID=194682 RepID=A0ACC1T2F4_9APHY|nr:hypothetical protein NM688_g4669 [Phlebia brevispora]
MRPPSPSRSSRIAQFESDLFSKHCANIVLTLVCYEYVLGLHHEYGYRRRKWTTATWLLLASRYVMLAVALTGVMPYTEKVSAMFFILSGPPIANRGGFVVRSSSALRVFALLNRNYMLGGVVLFFGLVPAVVNGYLSSRAHYYYVHDRDLGASCFASLTLPRYYWISASLSCPATAAITDIITVVVTWRKTYRHVRSTPALIIRDKFSVSATLLRDGSIYFMALFVLNLMEILVNSLPAFANAGSVVLILRMYARSGLSALVHDAHWTALISSRTLFQHAKHSHLTIPHTPSPSIRRHTRLRTAIGNHQ